MLHSVYYTEVDYKYTYNQTLKHIYYRKYKVAGIDLLKINLFFWYRQIPSEDVGLLKLYNNMMLIWLIFNKKFKLENYDSTLRRGVYYYRLTLNSDIIKENEKLEFLDIFVNGVMPLMRASTISSYITNGNIVCKLADMGTFSNTRMGEFFYVENITDKLHIKFGHKSNIKINDYLSILKINGLQT